MSRHSCVRLLSPALVSTLFLPGLMGLAAQPAGHNESAALVIIDDGGKEHKLTSWKFVEGTRRLRPTAERNSDKGAELEVLEVTEGKAAPLKVRITTLVPLESVRTIEFDGKKQSVTVTVAAKDKDLVLTGVTGYVGVNIAAIQAESDLGEFGKAQVKFRGGVARGVRTIRFPSPKPLEAVPNGRTAKLFASDSPKMVHAVTDMDVLYSLRDGTLRKDATLQFEKTVRVGLDKIRAMSLVGNGRGRGGKLVFDVRLSNGVQKPLVLVEQRPDQKKQPEFLIGLIGRTDAGFKLIPPERIGQLTFDDSVRP